MEDTAEVIEALKHELGVETDTELARRLGVDKSTVAAWRLRKSVPPRYRRILDGDGKDAVSAPPMIWGDIERAAFKLAVFRVARVNRTAFFGELGDAMEAVSASGALFWIVMHRAKAELSRRMADLDNNVETALAVLIQEDLSAGDDSIERTRQAMRSIYRARPPGAPSE